MHHQHEGSGDNGDGGHRSTGRGSKRPRDRDFEDTTHGAAGRRHAIVVDGPAPLSDVLLSSSRRGGPASSSPSSSSSPSLSASSASTQQHSLSHFPQHPVAASSSSSPRRHHNLLSSSSEAMGRPSSSSSSSSPPRPLRSDAPSSAGELHGPSPSFADKAYFLGGGGAPSSSSSSLSSSSSALSRSSEAAGEENGHRGGGLGRSRDANHLADKQQQQLQHHHQRHHTHPQPQGMSPPRPTYHSQQQHQRQHYPQQQQHHDYASSAHPLHLAYGQQGPMESVIEVSANRAPREHQHEQLRQEKKEKLSSSSAARPPPKPQSPVIIQWLEDNFDTDLKSSVPRSLMYAHYTQFCQQSGVKAVNAASFGKLIRSVFPDLKTRRLGTRGNSKYHYYGIRIKPSSHLKNAAQLGADSDPPSPLATNPASAPNNPRLKVETLSPVAQYPVPSGEQQPTAPPHLYPLHSSLAHSSSAPIPPNHAGENSRQLPEFPPLQPSIRYEHAQAFMVMYRSHCQRLLDTMADRNFAEIESVMRHFWQSLPSHLRPVISCQGVIDQIAEKDEIVYAAVVEALVPDVLAPASLPLTQAIREFSRQLEGCIARALEGQPQALYSSKIKVGRNFAGRLWREACVSYIVGSARQVLSNPDDIATILRDWDKVDFNFINMSISWLCGVDEPPQTYELLSAIPDEFRRILQQRYALEHMIEWIFQLGARFLAGSDLMQVMHSAQQMLMRYSYFFSLISTDFVMRNAPSAGAFHILRMFLEEYLTYMLDRRLATLQMMRMPPPPMPTYSTLPHLEQPAVGLSPAHEHKSSPLGSIDFLPPDGLFMRHRSNPDLSGHDSKFRPSILGKLPSTMFTSITERPHKQRRLAEGATAEDRTPSTPPSTGPPSPPPSTSTSSSSSSNPSIVSPPSSAVAPSSPSGSPALGTTGSSTTSSSSSASPPTIAALARTPSLPPLDLLDSLRGESITSPKPSLLPSSSLSSFSLGMGSFSGFGRDSFTNSFTAGGYVGPKMSFSAERDGREMPLPSASFLHKPSFGSFSSFPEFSRASFDRLGSMDRGSVAWPQLFLNLSTAHTTYQSFSLPIPDDKPGPLPPIGSPPSHSSSPVSSRSSSFSLHPDEAASSLEPNSTASSASPLRD